MKQHTPSSSILLAALLAAVCAGCSHVPLQADAPGDNYSARYGLLAPPAPACRVGDALDDKGIWIDANGASTESAATRRIGASFGQPVMARAARIAMNGDAIRNLAQVEVEDASGAWSTAWKGRLDSALPEGCESVWLVRKLDGRTPVAALRFSFRQAATQLEVSGAALLQD